MLIDRVLVGLGVVVMSSGAVLGWMGFTGGTETATAASSPLERVVGPVPVSVSADDDAAGDDAAGQEASTPYGPVPLGDIDPDQPGDDGDDGADGADGDDGTDGDDASQAREAEDLAARERAAERRAEEAARAEADRDKATKDNAAQEKATKDNAAKDNAEIDVEALRETYSYGPHGTSNEMDVYRPEGTATGRALPTVVLVHGGSWVSSSKAVWRDDVAPFLEAGYTTVAVNYRLAGVAAWPAQRTDVVAAVTELRENGARYNVDPDRIVLLGSSAGAHIAASAATWDGASGLVRGFVSMSGPLDLYELATDPQTPQDARLAERIVEELIRCEPTECIDRYLDATPASHLDPDDVGSLLVAAEGDWVDPQGARDFAEQSNDLGVDSDLVLLPGSRHGMDLWPAARSHAMAWIAARLAD